MSGKDDYDEEDEEDNYEDFMNMFKGLGDPSKIFGNFDPAKLFKTKEFQKMFKEIFGRLMKNLHELLSSAAELAYTLACRPFRGLD